MQIDWVAPDRVEDSRQDRMARGLLQSTHQLRNWSWGSVNRINPASRLLGLASSSNHSARRSVNRSDLIVYDLRYLPEQHWCTQIALRLPGMVCVTSEQLSSLSASLVRASLALAVEGPDDNHSEVTGLTTVRLGWPYPLSTTHARPGSRERLQPRVVLLMPEGLSDGVLGSLPDLPCQWRWIGGDQPRARLLSFPREVWKVPRSAFEVEVSRADLILNLGDRANPQTYFDQMRILSAGRPVLTQRAGWLDSLPAVGLVPEASGGLDLPALFQKVEQLLVCPWELQVLALGGSQFFAREHSATAFSSRLSWVARQAGELRVARAHCELTRWVGAGKVCVAKGSEILDGLLKPTQLRAPNADHSSRLAFLSPLPPERSGVSVYSAHLLGQLCRLVRVDIFSRGYQLPEELLELGARSFPHTEFLARDSRCSYGQVVYHIGNNAAYHREIVEIALLRPGTVVLHDTHLGHLIRSMHPTLWEFAAQLHRSLGHGAEQLLAEVRSGRRSLNSLTWTMVNREIVQKAARVIVHSAWDRAEVLRENPDAGEKIFVAPLCTPVSRATSLEQRQESRTRLGFSPDDFVIASFGFIEVNKKVDSIVGNLSEFLKGHPSAWLVLVGKLSEGAYGREVQALIDDSGVAGQIRVTGFLDSDEYEHYLRSCDLSIQFRRDFRGGGSLSVNQSLACGIPTLITSEGPFLEYPQDVVLHVPPSQEKQLGSLVEACFANPQQTRELGQRGWAFAQERFFPPRCAAVYADILGLAP